MRGDERKVVRITAKKQKNKSIIVCFLLVIFLLLITVPKLLMFVTVLRKSLIRQQEKKTFKEKKKTSHLLTHLKTAAIRSISFSSDIFDISPKQLSKISLQSTYVEEASRNKTDLLDQAKFTLF